jgi:hypothetical protein
MTIRFIAIILLLITALGAQRAFAAVPEGFSVLGTTIPASAENIPIQGGFSESFAATNTTLPTISPGDQARGYVLFVTNPLEQLYSYTRPQAAEIGDTVILCSVTGEYEPATFSIHALSGTNMSTVQVALTSTLTDGNSNTIHSENVDIRTVRVMPRWNSSSSYIVSPTLLEQRASVNIDQNTTQQYWITVFVPTGTTPGTYTATLQISASGLSSAAMTLEVEVLAITLQDPGRKHGMYYHDRDVLAGTPLSPGRISDDLTNMGEHGMRVLFLSNPADLPDPTLFLGQVNYDTSPLNPVRDAVLANGFDAVIINMTVDDIITTPGGIPDFPQSALGYSTSLQNAGWPQIINSWGDESDSPLNDPTSHLAVKGKLAGLKSVMPAEQNYTTIVFPENSEVFEPDLDIRAFSSYVDDSVIAPTASAGRELWIYSGPSGFGLNGKAERFYRGIWSSLFDLDGVMDWIYFRPQDLSAPFDDLIRGHRNNMTCWVFPGVDGPLNSPGWEAMREGIEDDKYIYTLETLIDQANNSGNAGLIAMAAAAQAWLDQQFAQIDTSARANDSIFPVKREADLLTPSFFTDFRKQAGVHIGLLSGAIDPQSCEEVLSLGLGKETDFNNDCYVNLVDFSWFTGIWMDCYDPSNPACTLDD